jgi:hypothetical protein
VIHRTIVAAFAFPMVRIGVDGAPPWITTQDESLGSPRSETPCGSTSPASA